MDAGFHCWEILAQRELIGHTGVLITHMQRLAHEGILEGCLEVFFFQAGI